MARKRQLACAFRRPSSTVSMNPYAHFMLGAAQLECTHVKVTTVPKQTAALVVPAAWLDDK